MKTSLRDCFKISAGNGKHRVDLTAVISGEDITVIISGGEKPHVGAVAIAVPRPGIRDSGKISSTSSVFTLSGHKDDEIARPVSERIAKNLNRVTVVVAGVHVDKAHSRDIELLLSNSMKCTQKLLAKFGA
jgi:hypothetical protein